MGTSRNHIHVVDRQYGKLLSSYQLEDIRRDYQHCKSVVHKEGYIYFVASKEHGQGSIKLRLYADDKLFIYGHNGVVQLFSLTNGLPEMKSEMRMRYGSAHHFSFPAIVDGVMYIRRGHALMAFAVK